ncbi:MULTISPECIES: hypothetical protein [Clostridium]|uniref:Uncharacterized protein n=2 Tax=Clostridium TaxID=1485 RepID=A0AAP9UFL9_CLOBU|nr:MULTISPECIES: hypothetical protein [Clostridium]MBZ5747372.1 hypothetical protein [Clostridium butyricum]MDI9208389.1 hypothetical protein [Clostridium butyricum]MDU2894090.1 hypothetical protein [Clostridium sp.]MDU3005868.1 hypothetical protein [Clostridium sp.]MDU3036016.1 hypothetical protein [Clostridium sp.]
MYYDVDKKIDYREILLDPFNPRFDGKLKKMTQRQIIEHIKKGNDYKELLESMKKGIRWINLIVIRPIDDLDLETKEKINISDISKYKYIVIEGNTRLACLYDHTLEKESNNIPVSIFRLSDNEKNDSFKRKEYNLEIMYIQGQANILKVKDWNEKPKCEHVYRTFIERRKLNNSEKVSKIIKDLAERFSGNSKDIKKALVRCSIVRKFQSFGYKIDEKDWSYLEAVETGEGNSYMGLNDMYEFDSNLTEKSQKILRDRYEEYYNLVQDYKSQNKNSKKFRNEFKKKYLKDTNINIPLESTTPTKIIIEDSNEKNDNKKNKKNVSSDDFIKNQNKNITKIRNEFIKQKKDIDIKKSINIEGKDIYVPHTEIDLYGNFMLLKYIYPKYININIPSYSQNTTYDSLAYYDNDEENLFWCDFKKVLPNEINNCIENLHTIICWEISHKDIYNNFVGLCMSGEKINLILKKNELKEPGYKFQLINEEKNINIEIIELKDIWEIVTRKKFM